MGTGVHRRFSPSQADRLFACPGSVQLLAKLPPRDSSFEAEEGTLAHKVLEACINGRHRKVNDGIADLEAAGYDTSNSVIYEKFHSSINAALNYIWEIFDELNIGYDDAQIKAEIAVDCPSASAPGETGGVCDVVLYSILGRIAYVIDYKHGAGVAVSVTANKQATQYACGVFFARPVPMLVPSDFDEVNLVILQPRAFHAEGNIREFKTTPTELSFYPAKLDAAINVALGPNPPLRPEVDICRFCDARSSCPALARSSLLPIVKDFDGDVMKVNKTDLVDPKTLDMDRLAHVLRLKPLITAWLNGCETHAEELSRKGKVIPGFKRVEARAQRQWYGQMNDIATNLAALIGCEVKDLYKPAQLINITDAEELVANAFKARVQRKNKKRASEEASQMFAYFTLKKSSGATTLVPLEDARTAVQPARELAGIGSKIPNPNKEV